MFIKMDATSDEELSKKVIWWKPVLRLLMPSASFNWRFRWIRWIPHWSWKLSWSALAGVCVLRVLLVFPYASKCVWKIGFRCCATARAIACQTESLAFDRFCQTTSEGVSWLVEYDSERLINNSSICQYSSCRQRTANVFIVGLRSFHAGVYLDFLTRGMVAVLGRWVTERTDFAYVPL